MKNFLITAALLFLFNASFNAQVTITMEQVIPEVGDEYHAYLTNYVDVSAQIGADQIWDFNDLLLNDSDNHFEIIEPISGLGNGWFPDADVAYELVYDGISCFEYLTTDEGVLDYMGRFDGTEGEETILSYSNYMLKFPESMTLGDSGEDDFFGIFSSGGSESSISGSQTWVALGDGTLLINDHTYNNVILVKWEHTEGLLNDIAYSYYQAGNFLPVLTFIESTESDPDFPDETYFTAFYVEQEIEVGILEQSQEIDLSIFPNPIQQGLSLIQLKLDDRNNLIRSSDEFRVELWDVQGRKVTDLLQGGKKNNFNSNIDLRLPSSLDPGTYFVRLVGDNINVSEKLIVQ